VSDSSLLFSKIKSWGQSLGFDEIGVSSIDLSHTTQALLDWLDKGFHGEMAYMKRHGLLRAHPEELVPGTISVITARMNYLSPQSSNQGEVKKAIVHFNDNSSHSTPMGSDLTQQNPSLSEELQHAHWAQAEWDQLNSPDQAYVSLYARGRDYHKSVKKRLEQLAQLINAEVASLGYRVFCDSAPVMEVALAARSGLGWRGKHTLLLNRQAGSMFFLGEIFVNFDLLDQAPQVEESGHCGTCRACIDVCPTQAIIAPYQLDARKCISYLTIEHPGSIDVALRPLMGNRIYGCDDCQLICPWNKFAKTTELSDFKSREALTHPTLLGLWQWSEAEFLSHTEGSAIRRIGHERWLRNLAIAIGNALGNAMGNALNNSSEHASVSSSDPDLKQALQSALALRLEHPSEVVREHVRWALDQA